jgi:cytochrome P450
MTTGEPAPACPVHPRRDDRKSARLAAEHLLPPPGAKVASRFLFARDILRSGAVRQGFREGAERWGTDDPSKVPVIFLDGEAHRRRRAEISRFFTPMAIATRYRDVMERTTDALLARLRSDGRGVLDQISFDLAVAVAADIVGLTNSSAVRMAPRISKVLSSGIARGSNPVARLLAAALRGYHALSFFWRDVKPGVASVPARRAAAPLPFWR